MSSDAVTVVFVDDDPMVVQSLRRIVQRQRRSWTLHLANSGAEAVRLLDEITVDAIVSDGQMPGMDGAELLEHVRRSQPTAARIVLSGEVRHASLQRTLVAAHEVLSKPCDTDDLCAAIEPLVKLRRTLAEPMLASTVLGLGPLPEPPAVLLSLRELLGNDATVAQVACLVASDMALSAKLLRLVNSSYFGQKERINSIDRAVMVVGLRGIEDLVTASAALGGFPQVAADISEIITAHSQLVAVECASLVPASHASATYTAALLHELGWLVIAATMPERFAALRVETAAHGAAREQQPFHPDHALAGAALLRLWNVPDDLVEAVAWHHLDGQPDHSLAATIAKADRRAHHAGGGLPWEPTPLDEAALP